MCLVMENTFKASFPNYVRTICESKSKNSITRSRENMVLFAGWTHKKGKFLHKRTSPSIASIQYFNGYVNKERVEGTDKGRIYCSSIESQETCKYWEMEGNDTRIRNAKWLLSIFNPLFPHEQSFKGLIKRAFIQRLFLFQATRGFAFPQVLIYLFIKAYLHPEGMVLFACLPAEHREGQCVS